MGGGWGGLSQRQAWCRPELTSLPHSVAVGKSLKLPEPQFPHQENGNSGPFIQALRA